MSTRLVTHGNGTTIATTAAVTQTNAAFGSHTFEHTGRHAFVLIGAPVTQTVADLKAAFASHPTGLTLFIEADLTTYMAQITGPSPNVYSIPTNMRAPYQFRPARPGEGTKPIVFGDVPLDSFAAFMAAQQMVSQAAQDILEFASANAIPTFFAIVARKQRPTHIQVAPEGGKVVALPPDEGPRASHPGSDQALSELALRTLVEPASAKAGRSLLEDLTYCTDHNATYLADVLAVIASSALTDDEKWWQRWDLASCEIGADGTHSKVVFGDKDATTAATDVPYCKATFAPNLEAGLFRSMDSTDATFDLAEFKEICRARLEAYATGTPTAVWDTCYVAHDAFALDVDDLPAIELARSITVPGGFTDSATWRESSL